MKHCVDNTYVNSPVAWNTLLESRTDTNSQPKTLHKENQRKNDGWKVLHRLQECASPIKQILDQIPHPVARGTSLA
ncbi:hypothetical protein WH47_03978 [Habropoda laboriosa]|uniref:Uncharacterized protein n=1 Tax=Habropoda laboriosa TaxID=597456 RepID=A0A0L7QUC6_9HYME|nr:hypothetical protein WH47_03978 [Habropoda laboriosa]